MQRGEVWWASLPLPVGSEPGRSRPVVIIQNDTFNDSRIRTVVVAAVTSNIRRADAPGNVLVARDDSGLDRDSVINVSQILTVDKSMLTDRIGPLSYEAMASVERGLRLVLDL